MIKKMQKWWAGSPYENEKNSEIVFIGMVRPKLALLCESAWKYLKTHHQWLIGLAVATILALMTL